jgi:hypothetical protein
MADRMPTTDELLREVRRRAGVTEVPRTSGNPVEPAREGVPLVPSWEDLRQPVPFTLPKRKRR